MTTTLTKPQAEVLKAVIRSGGVALHLQTGRTQAVIRNLIKKRLLAIRGDGRVAPPEGTHYDFATVKGVAVDIGKGWSRATIHLGPGDTVWNPYSTKWYFAGDGVWTFIFDAATAELESAPETLRRVRVPH